MRTVPEWKASHDDQAIPARVQIRIFEKYGGKCAQCGRTIGGKIRPAYDHITALCNAAGGHREGNLQLLCVSPCHAEKSLADVAIKKKNNRVKAKHLGISAKTKRTFGGRGFARSKPQRTATRPIHRTTEVSDTPNGHQK